MTGLKKNVLTILFVTGCIATAAAQTRTLAFYINSGQSNSPLLKDDQNQIKSNLLDSLVLRASRRPQVLANGQLMAAPTIHGYGYDKAITNGGNYVGVISVSQDLVHTDMAPRLRDIALSNESLGNNMKINILDLKRDITSQYLTAYAAYRLWQANNQVFGLLSRQLKIVETLTTRGIYTQADYLGLQVALQSQEVSLEQLYIQYRTDIAALNYLCGIKDTAAVLLEQPVIPEPNPATERSSVFMRPYLIDSLRIVNNKSLTDSRYKPSLSWFADAGVETSQPGMIRKNIGASFGVNLSVPIYDGKQRSLEYRKLNVAEDTRKEYERYTQSRNEQQREMLMQQLRESDNLTQKISGSLKTVETLIEVYQKRMTTGDTRITDLVAALNNYILLENGLEQAKINRLAILNELNYLNH